MKYDRVTKLSDYNLRRAERERVRLEPPSRLLGLPA